MFDSMRMRAWIGLCCRRNRDLTGSGENADEIDAIGTKRYESTSGGEREIQRTMLELLNQLDGFDPMGDVKVRPPPLDALPR